MNGVGLGAFTGRSTAGESAYDLVGSDWSRLRQAELGAHAEQLKKLLQDFAARWGNELHSDAAFGAQYIELLSLAGIDPLAMSIKSSQGDIDFMNRLRVRIIEACAQSQGWNGGLLPVSHLVEQLNASAIGASQPITIDNVVAAVKSQGKLGPGIELITLRNGQMVVQTTAHELSSEQGDILAACDVLGYVTVPMLVDNLGWTRERCDRVLEQMVSGALLWIDAQATPKSYWSPGIL